MPFTDKVFIFNGNPPVVARPKDSGTRRTIYGNYGGRHHYKHNPRTMHDVPVVKKNRTSCRPHDEEGAGGRGWVELHGAGHGRNLEL